MRGAISTNGVLFLIALMGLVLSAAVLMGGIKVYVKQTAAPVPQAGAEVKEVPMPKLWSMTVVLLDSKTKDFVSDANVYLLSKKPADIYVTPTSNIVMSATGVSGTYTFENIYTDRSYFILAEANNYYNAGVEFNFPEKISKEDFDKGMPIVQEIHMDKKGTILGVQVPLTYRGSSADVAKLVYNSDNDNYEAEFSYVAGSEGVVKYKKIVIELNTDNLGSATIDTLKVTVGDEDFEFDNVSGTKTIKFDTEQTLDAGSTLPIKMVVEGSGLDGVSGELFKVTLYDVQEGNWTATVEGPA